MVNHDEQHVSELLIQVEKVDHRAGMAILAEV